MNSALTTALQAQWVARLLEGKLRLPSRWAHRCKLLILKWAPELSSSHACSSRTRRAAMHADIMHQQQWKRSTMAAAHNRCARDTSLCATPCTCHAALL